MDQESFESLIKKKMDAGSKKPPGSVWHGITSSLNDRDITTIQAKQERFKWLAVAASIVAVISFTLAIEPFTPANESNTVSSTSSYNALLPSGENHFRFFETSNYPQEAQVNQQVWSQVLFVREKKEQQPEPVLVDFKREHLPVANTIDRRSPTVNGANVGDVYVSPYYVARPDLITQNSEEKSTKFWAGVEAGAGSFNPDFAGSDPLAANVNFDALADNLGQGSFVNPTSSASRNGMDQGIATSVGLDFGVKVGRRWTIESGVQYTNVQSESEAALNVVDTYVISGAPVLGASGGIDAPVAAAQSTVVEENFDHSINLSNSIRFTSIPLKAGYFLVDKRVSLRLNAGVAANYFLADDLSDPTGQIENAEQVNGFNEWSFDGLTGFEVGYSIFDNFNLTLEPNYRQSITPLSESLNARSGFMIQTGLRYTIK